LSNADKGAVGLIPALELATLTHAFSAPRPRLLVSLLTWIRHAQRQGLGVEEKEVREQQEENGMEGVEKRNSSFSLSQTSFSHISTNSSTISMVLEPA